MLHLTRASVSSFAMPISKRNAPISSLASVAFVGDSSRSIPEPDSNNERIHLWEVFQEYKTFLKRTFDQVNTPWEVRRHLHRVVPTRYSAVVGSSRPSVISCKAVPISSSERPVIVSDARCHRRKSPTARLACSAAWRLPAPRFAALCSARYV